MSIERRKWSRVMTTMTSHLRVMTKSMTGTTLRPGLRLSANQNGSRAAQGNPGPTKPFKHIYIWELFSFMSFTDILLKFTHPDEEKMLVWCPFPLSFLPLAHFDKHR